MTAFFEFREQWLSAAVDELRGYFTANGHKLPSDIKVSCGWPVGSRGSLKVLGQCFAPEASGSGSTEIFISPTVDEPNQVLGILMHELVHAAVGVDKGHGPVFKKACERLGLEGPATSAMPSDDLEEFLSEIRGKYLGEYPHSHLDYTQRKKQGTRLIKVVCPVSGYTVRITQKWIETGLPVSPAGHVMEVRD